jgi:hypothetical protein
VIGLTSDPSFGKIALAESFWPPIGVQLKVSRRATCEALNGLYTSLLFMAFYLHSTYNVAAVKKLSREKDIFWQTFCTECQFFPVAAAWTKRFLSNGMRAEKRLSSQPPLIFCSNAAAPAVRR